MPPVSIIAVNIEKSKHLDLVAPFLAGRMPEVVCVQELIEGDIQTLSTVLGGAACVFAPMTRVGPPGIDRVVMGVGIFSRLPIRDTHVAYYHGDSEHVPDFDATSMETKSATLNIPVILCDIEKEGVVVRIGTTHFTWTPDGRPSDYQRQDIKELLRALVPQGEFVLTGDFNAPRGGEIFAQLASRYKDNIPPEYTTSIDIALHRAGKTRPEELADKMVDGIFSTPGYQVSDVELVSGVSDHCAIVATIMKK